MPQNVRTHTRKDPRTGKTQTVRQHSRKGPNPGHAWKVGLKAVSHGRKKHHGLMLAFGLWALIETALWFLFQTTGLVAGVLGALLLGLAWVLRHQDRNRTWQ